MTNKHQTDIDKIFLYWQLFKENCLLYWVINTIFLLYKNIAKQMSMKFNELEKNACQHIANSDFFDSSIQEKEQY